jgi:hypothetical protein
LDELSQASQCKLAYLPYRLHDNLEDNTAILLPVLQIQNPARISITLEANKTCMKHLKQRTHADAETFKYYKSK